MEGKIGTKMFVIRDYGRFCFQMIFGSYHAEQTPAQPPIERYIDFSGDTPSYLYKRENCHFTSGELRI